ncbi:MAG: chemotaxis response regulator protein-glutamate methylesterase [Candidatus Poribacteria bacterium]|nr:chemotaxis response regulator protein-glutamate methylesterase [Candidatus Poribacteria bacterium]
MLETAPAKQINVLVVDDSMFIRTAIKRLLEADSEIKVVGMASDGLEAIEKIKTLQPHVVTMDIEMPRMDGLTALKKIMAENPLPVLMISTLTESGASSTIEALSLGALDYIPKQIAQSSLDILRIQKELHTKIKALAKRCPRMKPRSAMRKPQPVASPRVVTPKPAPAVRPVRMPIPDTQVQVVAIGTSTGGPKALQEIIPHFPANFRVGVLVVQHMPPFFTKSLADRLNSLSQLTVKEAEPQEIVEPGKVLIAPGGQHMSVIKRGGKGVIRLSESPTDLHHTPSVDVMMTSVAEVYRQHAVGVILTGMGHDGLEGMTAIHQKKGLTLAQDESTSVIYGMPRACVEEGFVDQILPLDRVAETVIHLVQKGGG